MPTASKVKSCGRNKTHWLNAQAELLYREQIPKSGVYDHNKAYELLPKARAVKSPIRCKLRCLADGLKVKKASTFGAHPPRKFYAYKDIQRYYTFKDDPKLLVIACYDTESRSRSYEVFASSDNQIEGLCEIIDRAHAHPMCILVGDDAPVVNYHSSHSSLASESEIQTELAKVDESSPTRLSTVEVETNGEEPEEVIKAPTETSESAYTGEQKLEQDAIEMLDIPIENNLVEEVCIEAVQSVQNAEPYYHIDTAYNEEEPPVQTEERQTIPDRLRSDPLFEKLYRNVEEDDLWAVDMTYINNHPTLGNQIVTEGGVYLFVAHHRYPETHHQRNERAFGVPEENWNTADLEFTTRYVKSHLNGY